MSAKHSQFAACTIADADEITPGYHPLTHLQVSFMQAEQPLVRASTVNSSTFAEYTTQGERIVQITLEGLSNGSQGEGLLRSGLLLGVKRLFRFDTAQGQRLSGTFWVTQFTQEAKADRFETIRAELRSHGAVTFATI